MTLVSPFQGLDYCRNSNPGRRYAAVAAALCPGLACDAPFGAEESLERLCFGTGDRHNGRLDVLSDRLSGDHQWANAPSNVRYPWTVADRILARYSQRLS